nr:hypothetical protein [uncultured Cohaesibacter sp.]
MTRNFAFLQMRPLQTFLIAVVATVLFSFNAIALTPIATLYGVNDAAFMKMAFSQDGQKLAVTVVRHLSIYDLSKAAVIFEYDLPHSSEGVAFLGDGHSVAVAYGKDGAEIIDTEDLNDPLKRKVPGEWEGLSLSRDGKYLISAVNIDNEITVVATDWRLADGPQYRANTKLMGLTFDADTTSAATALTGYSLSVSGLELFDTADGPANPDPSNRPAFSDTVMFLDQNARNDTVSVGYRDIRTLETKATVLSKNLFPKLAGFQQTPRGPRTMLWIATNEGARLFVLDMPADKLITNQLFPGEDFMQFGFSGNLNYRNTAMSPDGMLVAMHFPDHSIRIFASDEAPEPQALINKTTSEGTPVLALTQGHQDLIHKTVFSPDGGLFATTAGSGDRRTHIWETQTGRQVRSIATGDFVDMLQFSPDGKKLVTSSVGSMDLWDVDSGRHVGSLPAANLTMLAYIGNSDHLIACDTANCMIGKEFEILDFKGDKLDLPTGWYTAGGAKPSVSADGLYAGMILADGSTLLIDIKGRTAQRNPQNAERVSLALGNDGKGIWGLKGGKIELFNAQTGEVTETLKIGTDEDEVRILPLDGTRFILEIGPPFQRPQSLAIFDSGTGTVSNTLPDFDRTGDGLVHAITGYAPKENALYVASNNDFFSDKEIAFNTRIDVWSLTDNQLMRSIMTNSVSPESLTFSRDGNELYVNGEHKEATWDLISGKVVAIANATDGKRQFASQNGRIFQCREGSDKGRLCYSSKKTGEYRVNWETEGEKTTKFETDGISNGKDLLFVSWLDDVVLRVFDMEAIDRGENGLKSNFKLEGGNDNSYPDYLLSPDSSRVLTFHKEIALYEVGTGKRLWKTRLSDGYLNDVAFSVDGTKILVFEARGGDHVIVLDSASGKKITVVQNARLVKTKVGTAGILSLADETTFSLLDDAGNALSGPIARLNIGEPEALMDAPTGLILLLGREGRNLLWDTRGGENRVQMINSINPGGAGVAFSADGNILALTETTGLVSLWRVEDCKKIASLATLIDGGWAVIGNDGRYDASDPGDFPALGWVMPDEPEHVLPIELFYREYYEPTLLSRLLNGQEFPELPKLSDMNRLQPQLHIAAIEQDVAREGQATTVSVTVDFRETEEKDKASGIGTIKLFRDGQLVGQHTPTAEEKSANGSIRFQHILLPKAVETQIAEGNGTTGDDQQTVFTAYAFNGDGIKSSTVRMAYDLPAIDAANEAKRKAYVISVGIDLYDNPAWNLNFAGADASVSADDVTAGLEASGSFDEVVPIKLVSSKAAGHKNGTRDQISAVLGLLGGQQVDRALLSGVDGEERLDRAMPEDMVFFFFAGHGLASQDGEFYLFPKDFDPNTSGREINAAILARAMGSSKLAQLFLSIQSNDIVLIIDACNSAASVNGKGFKPGPMGSRGLGQLAYDKGMRILTASQAEGVALESSVLRHGALSYALFREGVENTQADRAPADDQISFSELLSYGVERVPTLYEEIVTDTFTPQGRGGMSMSFVVSGEAEEQTKETRYLQQPSLFDFKKPNMARSIYLAKK